MRAVPRMILRQPGDPQMQSKDVMFSPPPGRFRGPLRNKWAEMRGKLSLTKTLTGGACSHDTGLGHTHLRPNPNHKGNGRGICSFFNENRPPYLCILQAILPGLAWGGGSVPSPLMHEGSPPGGRALRFARGLFFDLCCRCFSSFITLQNRSYTA